MNDPLRRLTDGEGLVNPRNTAIYAKALAEELIKIVCALDDTGFGAAVVRRMRTLDDGAYLPDLVRQLTGACPDLYHIRVIRPTWSASATSGSRPFPCRGPARRRG